MPSASEIATVLSAALPAWAAHRETLRELDAAVGDGDLGITVSSGAEAVAGVLAESEPTDVGALLQAAGRKFATANPSTFAALVGGGVMWAAKPLVGKADAEAGELLAFGEALAARIQEKGKSEPGDKTILDALLPSLAAGRAAEAGAVLADMRAAARTAVEESTQWESKRGRAGWLGARTVGHADPGATAYVLFLDALAAEVGRE
ncbi:MAG: DAK2 domain-containing protein [Arachnia sp.]